MPKTSKPIPLPVVATSNAHLKELIDQAISTHGRRCDLNHIDVSGLTDLSDLFMDRSFSGNISKWDTRNATSMARMFMRSSFNGDISGWNVSGVETMAHMFDESNFEGSLADWDVSKVTTMDCMFSNSSFNGDVSKWNVSNVTNMNCMFRDNSVFDHNLSTWDLRSIKTAAAMFSCAYNIPDVSSWNLSTKVDTKIMFNANRPGLSRQTPCDWNIPFFLGYGMVPEDLAWKKAFEDASPMAQAIGLDRQSHVQLILAQYRNDCAASESFDLPEGTAFQTT